MAFVRTVVDLLHHITLHFCFGLFVYLSVCKQHYTQKVMDEFCAEILLSTADSGLHFGVDQGIWEF